MIPGPVEFDPEVMRALARRTLSHVAPEFIQIFGRALARLREVCLAPSAQPFVVAGSGTLAMEMAAANLVEPGERALVVNTGYFSDRLARILERHGAEVVQVRAAPGDAPDVSEVERALASGRFKVLTVTHVDTSTGVLAPVEPLVRLAHAHGVLSVVDGVCATAGETFHQDAWGADVYFTASQKAVGVPPGLALLTASPRALAAWRARRRPVASVYADWAEWLPIMEAYEGNKASYFATPAVNLVCALDVSLGQLLAEGMEARFARHVRMARAFRAGWSALGLKALPAREPLQANTLSALYYPEGVDAGLVAAARAEGVVLAGGLHPELKTRYFRVGHMNAVNASDVLATVGAVERALARVGYKGAAPGAGVAAAQAALVASAPQR
ncbi:alanine--glyoxylate aminotransferase family protein [Aggregicoccus sp. 17bor-14]|uniref:pyridoxal-phosphate-dependent aminotransferase family protein n=1 Tax=Myxococcaceae TaxID=31 RepID=UPI00129C732D|nr:MULTISPECIES: alanine--glyoxylate aminotransferase family protein [Myxococcaceae]MBF5046437.1 alanine--glyoxylate aminotransferase family protein [Simulacricoccus sp. 17bor-14]MRI92156.1 alanine--glyoxylate aminotransferase family protein [Aggregicoccus sp. 17bor-14]